MNNRNRDLYPKIGFSQLMTRDLEMRD